MFIVQVMPPPGPMPPAPKVLRLGSPTQGFDVGRAAKFAAREMGATVVVEDFLFAFPPLPPSLRLGLFRWRNGDSDPVPSALAPPAQTFPAWMNPSVVRAGGNVVGQVYGFGGAAF